jgi:hypothetical protein
MRGDETNERVMAVVARPTTAANVAFMTGLTHSAAANALTRLAEQKKLVRTTAGELGITGHGIKPATIMFLTPQALAERTAKKDDRSIADGAYAVAGRIQYPGYVYGTKP